MKQILAAAILAGCLAAGASASAQVIPQTAPLENRIPAPLPRPSQPPVINGLLAQSEPPEVVTPRPLNTFGDRVTRCLQEGSGAGVIGSSLETQACANEN